MSWSLQVGRAFGIPIRLHLTFLLLIGWLGFRGIVSGDLALLFLAVGLFASVLAHELGHSVVAQRYGVRVLDITLLPIGGLARMATVPKEPREEFWIAVAGPAVNFVLAPVLYAAHRLLEHAPEGGILEAPGLLFGKLAWLNLSIGLFNLLPAFPMDGGRILRALLASRMPHAQATARAAALGQLTAMALGFVGLTNGAPMLVLVAIFVFIGAAEEGARAQTQTFVQGALVRNAMMTSFYTLSRADSLGRAADLLLDSTQHDFPVVEEGEMIGILTRRALLEGLARGGRELYATEVMEPTPDAVEPDAPLDDILERMMTGGEPVVPVHDAQGLCGLLTLENATEYVLVQAALGRSRA